MTNQPSCDCFQWSVKSLFALLFVAAGFCAGYTVATRRAEEAQREPRKPDPTPESLADAGTPKVSPQEPALPERVESIRPLDDGNKAGQEWRGNGLAMKFCWCPPGEFKMGEERDAVDVKLTRGFWLGKHEVTQAQYRQVMKGNPSHFSATGEGQDSVAGLDTGHFPVEMVSWDEATEFCRRLTEQERLAGRLPTAWEYTLPTEAQWEFACRAGTQSTYFFGDLDSRIVDFAWHDANAEKRPHEVGQKLSNPWGLHDVHGNVAEWCRDWYQEKLPGGVNPEVTGRASSRVIRGGGWSLGANSCRSAKRSKAATDDRNGDLGFRVALMR